MPGFDGTGPRGQGSFTGKGLGYCVVKLDSDNSEKVVNILKQLAQLHQTTLVVVTHDDKVANHFPVESTKDLLMGDPWRPLDPHL